MKTSTKIFLGVAAAAAAICAANAINAGIQYKKLTPVAEELAAELDRKSIRVVCLTNTDETGQYFERFSRQGSRKSLNINSAALQTAYISGDTLFISGWENTHYGWEIFNSPDLETVIVRREGEPERLMDYKPAPEQEQESEPEPDTGNE